MAREIRVLKVKDVPGMKTPGRHKDGGGLYFYVTPAGSRSWVFRYRDRVTGKRRDKGLGPFPDIGLEDARKRAAKCRRSLLDGLDPIDEPRRALEAVRDAKARQRTFGDCARQCHASKLPEWKNVKHAAQWINTVKTYAAPLMEMPVHEVETVHIMRVLEPIWTDKSETATRVRERLENVLDWAATHGHRDKENPARWKGHLDNLLPKPSKVKKVEHHPSMPYTELGEFMTKVVAGTSLSAMALRLQIQTATRPGEACGARWEEFDFENKVWNIPSHRMKAERGHRVPLAPDLMAMLQAIPRDSSGYLFPGATGKELNTASPLKLLKELRPGLTCHGFRATFRVWGAEQTNYPRDVLEEALAHTMKDKAEAAYRQTDMLEKRARLMVDWERYCLAGPRAPGSVSPIRKTKGS